MKGLFSRIAARNLGSQQRRRIDGISPPPTSVFATSHNSAESPGADVAPAIAKSGLDKQNSDTEVVRGRIRSQIVTSPQSNAGAIERPANLAEPIVRNADRRASVEPATQVSRALQAVRPELAAKLEPRSPHRYSETTASSTSRRVKRSEANPEVSIQTAISPEQPSAPVQPPVAAIVKQETRTEPSQRFEKPTPAVHVTIGVVEVRATAVAPGPPPRSVPVRRKSEPALSIDTYLADRQAGRR